MPSEFEGDDRLFECPEGCGRSFNAKALEKHAKVLYNIIKHRSVKKYFNRNVKCLILNNRDI